MAKLDLEGMERRTKWLLLVVSVATLVLLIVSALQENVFDEWRLIRRDYAKILEAKATGDRGKAIAAQFEVGIDQIVLPALGSVDRCITCHTGLDDPRMVDEAQPFTTHPADILFNHPPEEFGCTICHQGQGRATKTAEAHGDSEDWLYPMLEKQYLYSSCRKCHQEDLLFGDTVQFAFAEFEDPGESPAGGAAIMAHGKRLLETKGCLGCHVLDGRGGTLGPDITFVGDKTRHEFDFSHFDRDEPRDVAYWLKKHFLEPQEISPETLMPDMGLTGKEAEALTAYVLSLKARDLPAEYSAPVPIDLPEPVPPTGAELYQLMCAACHGSNGQASDVPGIRSPALNNVDALAVCSDNYLRFIIDQGRSDTAMPPWGPESGNMTYAEIDRIIEFIRGWESDGPDLADIGSSSGDAAMGEIYYQGLCANCHGRKGGGGIGNALNSPTFLAIVSDRFLAETIVNGRPGTAMASWRHLPAQGVSDILAYLRSWEAVAPAFAEVREELARYSPEENARVGKILYRGNCALCHGEGGEGGIGPRLNSIDVVPAVDDRYLYKTIVGGRPTTAMPAWKHLSADRIAALIAYMRSWSDDGPRTLEKSPPRGDYDLGKVHYNRACVACHGEGGRGGVGPRLINPEFLRVVSDDVLFHWIAHGRAGTAMIGFLEEEQGIIQLTAEQIADVIAYLRYMGSRSDRPIVRTGIGDPNVGRQLFEGSCASCHGRDGEGASGPQLNNETFLRTASDGFLAATIALGRTGTPMRSMLHGQDGIDQIAPKNVQDIIAYMRLWDVPQPWRRPRAIAEMSPRAIDSGREKFAQYCAGCHGPNGLGTADGEDHFAPALNNPEFLNAASDGFLLATIARGRSNTPMRPFGVGAGGIASLDAGSIGDIVSYIRTWQEAYAPKGE